MVWVNEKHRPFFYWNYEHVVKTVKKNNYVIFLTCEFLF